MNSSRNRFRSPQFRSIELITSITLVCGLTVGCSGDSCVETGTCTNTNDPVLTLGDTSGTMTTSSELPASSSTPTGGTTQPAVTTTTGTATGTVATPTPPPATSTTSTSTPTTDPLTTSTATSPATDSTTSTAATTTPTTDSTTTSAVTSTDSTTTESLTTTTDTTSASTTDTVSSTSTEQTTDTSTTGAASLCPNDASYCADFESGSLPDGTVYKRYGADPMAGELPDFVIDSMVSHSGGKSLRVKTSADNSGSNYRMLAGPTPGSKFWVRAYLRSDQALGAGSVSESEHNAWFGASVSEDPNALLVEVANDCGIAFNTSDQVKRPTSSDPNCATPYSLPADTWYCFEALFDGASGDTQLYVDGTLVLDAPGWAGGKGSFTFFKYGVNTFGHTKFDRKLWYDDIAVAPTRIGCL